MTLSSPHYSANSSEDHWIPLSDLMTGLMMMFLVVAIVFMVKVNKEAKRAEAQAAIASMQAAKLKSIAIAYSDIRAQIYDDLLKTFKDDLPVWHAVLSHDLSIRFEEPSVQFDTGLSAIKPDFVRILDSFFPRYAKVLSASKFKDEIEEVRIEGHTSSIWKGLSPEMAYYENMRLSQDRTRAVLQYVFALNGSREQLAWLVPRMTANGLSSSRRIFVAGREDYNASQRVEFRIRTKADDRLEEILGAISR
jgi:outer membrane protein OmpA-like peptidoglycan-associated protein